MTSPNLGTKRICPKCDAKFYDFGAVTPIKCPKCSHTWQEGAKKPAAKLKKEAKPPVKPRKSILTEDGMDEDVDLPDVDDSDDALEPMDDDGVELTSLEEVEEHEEEDNENDPNSDDATDEMFTEMVGGEKLVDDLEDHMEDEEDEDEEEREKDEDEDDDDDRPKKRRR